MIFINTIKAFLRDKDYRDLLLTTLLILIIGTITYHYVEGWSWIDSLYFCVITLTTVGYGDFSPQTDIGKMFTILYIVAGVGIILGFINTIYNHYEKERKKRKKKSS